MSSTPYDRQTSFALFSAENPGEPHPGTTLDAEFNAVKVALDDTQQNLALIQDDDGALKRGSVGKAQFDASVSIGFGAPSQWESGRLYTADVDTVFYQSKFYIANTTHTSGGTFDLSKWDEIADFTLAAIIEDGSITSAKLAPGAVTADKIGAGSISNVKLASGAVSTPKLADSSVSFVKLLASDIQAPLADLLLPAGLGPLPWSLPTLPTQGGWDWADGGVLLSTTPFATLRSQYIGAGFPFGQDGAGNPRKPDMRGRSVTGTDDMGAMGDAARLADANSSLAIVRLTLGGSGGAPAVTLTAAKIPTITSGVSVSVNVTGNSTRSDIGFTPFSYPQGTSGTAAPGPANFGGIGFSGSGTGSGTATSNNTGGGAHENMPPTLLCKFIIKAH
ncbi:hypothetical protein [Bradyrhizobium neotropicale]|uniref:hypothetical protein n=1 Tax=Bradyrhizobium neotropicale TaxID=1497615 RepID=UPI001AD7566F|nr:hypothetical protein [Bradyrhizobium neotropicale]MBO4228024.1 hypothetical protein [Bradyrhizobium neotropicale]